MKTHIKYPIGGFAPGFYTNRCVSCDEMFMGDKLARQCEPCAINELNENYTEAVEKFHQLKNLLEKIRMNNDLIKEILGESDDHE